MIRGDLESASGHKKAGNVVVLASHGTVEGAEAALVHAVQRGSRIDKDLDTRQMSCTEVSDGCKGASKGGGNEGAFRGSAPSWPLEGRETRSIGAGSERGDPARGTRQWKARLGERRGVGASARARP